MAVVTKSSNFLNSTKAKKSPKHLIEYLLKENVMGVHLSDNMGTSKEKMINNLEDQVRKYNRNSVQHYMIAFPNAGEIDDEKMKNIGLRAMQLLNYTPDDSNHLLTRHRDGRSPHIHFVVYTWQVQHTLSNAAIDRRRIPNKEFKLDYKKNEKDLEKQQYDISRRIEVEFKLPPDSVRMRSCKEYWIEARLRIKDRIRESISAAMRKATNEKEFVEYLENESREIFGEFMTMLEQEGRYRILSKVVGPPELKFYQNKRKELVFVINNFRCGDRKLGVDYSLEAIKGALRNNLEIKNGLKQKRHVEREFELPKKNQLGSRGLRFSVFELEPVLQLTRAITHKEEYIMRKSERDLTPLIVKQAHDEEKLKQERDKGIGLQQILIQMSLKAQLLLEEEEEKKRKELLSLEPQDLLKKIKEEELKIKNYYEKMDKEKLELLEKYLKELEMNIIGAKSLEQNTVQFRISSEVDIKTYEQTALETSYSLSKSMMSYLERKMIDKGDPKDRKYYSPEKVLKKLRISHSKKSIGELLESMVNIDPSNPHHPKINTVVERFKGQEIQKNREVYLNSIKDSFEFKLLVGFLSQIEPSLEFASRNFKIGNDDLKGNDCLLMRTLSGLTSFCKNIISTDKNVDSTTQIKINKIGNIDPKLLIHNPFIGNQNIRIRDQSLLFMYTAVLLRKMYKNEKLTKIVANHIGQQDEAKMALKNLAAQFELIGVLMLSYGPKDTLQSLVKQIEMTKNVANHIEQIPKKRDKGMGL